jgi:hypothetical protein
MRRLFITSLSCNFKITVKWRVPGYSKAEVKNFPLLYHRWRKDITKLKSHVHKNSWSVTIQSLNLLLKHFSLPPSAKILVNHLHKKYLGGDYYSAYGPITAAALLAETGNIKRFDNPAMATFKISIVILKRNSQEGFTSISKSIIHNLHLTCIIRYISGHSFNCTTMA